MFLTQTDFFEDFQENMESAGIQQLLAAEHEAQQIVNAARTGNYKFYAQSETLELLKNIAFDLFSLHVLISLSGFYTYVLMQCQSYSCTVNVFM